MKSLFLSLVALVGLSVFAADASAFGRSRTVVVNRRAPSQVIVNGGGYSNGATVIQSRSGIFGGRRQTIIVQ